MTLRHLILVFLLIGGSAATSVLAAPLTNQTATATSESPWHASVELGALHQFETSLDDASGDFHVNRLALRGGASFHFDPSTSVGITLGHDWHQYEFSGPSGLGAGDPWDEIQTYRISAPLQWGDNERWNAFVIPSVRWSAEEDADWSQALTGGGYAGVSYRFGERLLLGPGIGALTELEDNPTVFPMLLIRWQINDRWSLSTDRGLGATQGPGVILACSISQPWEFFVGGRYEKFRFRLDDRGANPDWIGEDEGIPTYVGATYRWSPQGSASAFAGVKWGGQLTLENSGGHRVARTDYDPSPLIGLGVRWRF